MRKIRYLINEEVDPKYLINEEVEPHICIYV